MPANMALYWWAITACWDWFEKTNLGNLEPLSFLMLAWFCSSLWLRTFYLNPFNPTALCTLYYIWIYISLILWCRMKFFDMFSCIKHISTPLSTYFTLHRSCFCMGNFDMCFHISFWRKRFTTSLTNVGFVTFMNTRNMKWQSFSVKKSRWYKVGVYDKSLPKLHLKQDSVISGTFEYLNSQNLVVTCAYHNYCINTLCTIKLSKTSIQ